MSLFDWLMTTRNMGIMNTPKIGNNLQSLGRILGKGYMWQSVVMLGIAWRTYVQWECHWELDENTKVQNKSLNTNTSPPLLLVPHIPRAFYFVIPSHWGPYLTHSFSQKWMLLEIYIVLLNLTWSVNCFHNPHYYKMWCSARSLFIRPVNSLHLH
jgi:hypothetical protein